MFYHYSYITFKIQILKDLAKALNFSYTINPPMDGFKWGGIDDNGKPFGLVADMRVGLLCSF